MSSKVSIVVPIYNAQEYLTQCVESLTGQDYENIEILLIDDGSTDNSSEICDNLQAECNKIRTIHKENGGAASARNLGVKEATGDYIMFIDADDWLELNAVSVIASHMDKHQLDVIRFNYVREYGDKSLEKKNTFLQERVYEEEECGQICRQVLGLVGEELSHPENMNFLASVCFSAYRRQLIIESGVEFVSLREIGSFEDGLFNFELFFYVKKYEFVDMPFYHYRKTDNQSASIKYRNNYLGQKLVLIEKIESVIEGHHRKEELQEALSSRAIYDTMELCFNALRKEKGFWEKRKEIRGILKNPQLKQIRKGFKLKRLPLKWKLYFFFMKHGWILPTYMMTAIVLKLKNKGV